MIGDKNKYMAEQMKWMICPGVGLRHILVLNRLYTRGFLEKTKHMDILKELVDTKRPWGWCDQPRRGLFLSLKKI